MRRISRCHALVLLMGIFAGFASSTEAHDVFTGYVQHRVMVSVGAKYMDVTVQLTFFEEGSNHERKHIDANQDGRLSRAEIDQYLRELDPKLARLVTLRIGGRPVVLTPLRATELDLLGQERVVRGHHRLTLYYFASTPEQLASNTELMVEDRLWPDSRALGSIQVEGKDGCRLEALALADPVFTPARDGESRSFQARILSSPASEEAKLVRDPKKPQKLQGNSRTNHE
jgi:hypothetical protein